MNFNYIPVIALILLLTNMVSSCPPLIVPAVAAFSGGLLGGTLIPRKMLFDENATSYATVEESAAKMGVVFNSIFDNLENSISLKKELENLTISLDKNETNYIGEEVAEIVLAGMKNLWNSVIPTTMKLMSLREKMENLATPLGKSESFLVARDFMDIVTAEMEKISKSLNHTNENLNSLILKMGNSQQSQLKHS